MQTIRRMEVWRSVFCRKYFIF